jgi:amino acid adenylation domain-containing protein
MKTKNVLEWLEESAKRVPDKVSFADPDGEISFAQLEKDAQRIGSFLCGKINRNEPVSFYLEKSTLAMSGMLGAVYAGGFYSLLDTRLPESRLQSILGVLRPCIILTDSKNREQAEHLFDKESYEIYSLEDILEINKYDPQELKIRREEALDCDPLYVNFTSGSTGIPKGVAVSHRSVIDFIEIFDRTFGIKETDILGNQAPFDFDVSVKDIFSGLYTGASVQIIPREYFSNPTLLMDYLCDRNATVLIWAVSAMCFVSIMNGFGYKVPEKVRMVLFSGEVMPVKQLNKWRKALPNAIYVNLYGPTEITCNCTYYVLDNREYAADEIIPIGRPFDNEKVFLLNEENEQILEPGKQGEICVSGTCLALGYYRDKEKTDTVFTQNPLNTCLPERIYHTGDLGQYMDNGNLVYSGRRDFQVKYLGHRIELNDIEAQVQSVNGIERACCLFNQEKKRLLLFYTGGRESRELAEELRKILPPYMLPNKLTKLDEMPMTKNGKIDRNILKQQEGIQK